MAIDESLSLAAFVYTAVSSQSFASVFLQMHKNDAQTVLGLMFYGSDLFGTVFDADNAHAVLIDGLEYFVPLEMQILRVRYLAINLLYYWPVAFTF